MVKFGQHSNASMMHIVLHPGRSLIVGVPTKPSRSQNLHVCRSVTEEQSDRLRLLPLVSSALGVAGVVANRLVDGGNPTLVASSSQSRADVAAICIAGVLGLTGLQWLSLKPKTPKVVELDGSVAYYISESFGNSRDEILRLWDAVKCSTKTDMLVIFWKKKCIVHLGCVAPGVKAGSAVIGNLCLESQEKDVSRSFANVALFPGRFEFLEYVPSNTQCIHVQPLHPDGVLVLGSATQRSFTILDQAWIATWCDKLFVTLENNT